MPTQPNIKAERISGDLGVNSLSIGYVSKAIAYAIGVSDYAINVTVAGATQTLPTAVGVAGKQYRVINASNSVVRVATTSSQTIGNSSISNLTYLDLQSEEWLDVMSDGANWKII